MTSVTFPIYARHDAGATAQKAHWPWVPAIVMTVCFALAAWSWDASQYWGTTDSADVSAMVDRIAGGVWARQLGFALLGCYGLFNAVRPGGRSVGVKLPLIYLVATFCVWAFISVAWSTDPSLTIKRLFVFGVMIVTIAAILKHFDIRQIAQIAFLASLATAAVGVINEFRVMSGHFPGFGLWRFGGTLHPNHAGLNCCVLLLSSLYLFSLSKRKAFLIFAAAALVLLVLTKSRTALMSGAAGVVMFLLLATTTARAFWAGLLVAWAVAAALWLSSIQMLPNFGSIITMGRDDVKNADVRKLTGRTDIWKYAIHQAGRDPNRAFIGYGFESFWTAENARGVSDVVKFKISEGHSAYLDWYLELGFAGLGLYLLVLLMALWRWISAAVIFSSPSAAIAAAVLVATVVHGVAESSLGDASLPTFFVYCAIAGATLLRPDEMEST